MVKSNTLRKEYVAKLTAAAKSSDKASFTTLMTEYHTKQIELRSANAAAIDDDHIAPNLTEAQKTAMIEEAYTRALADVASGSDVNLMGGRGFGRGFGPGGDDAGLGGRGKGGPGGMHTGRGGELNSIN